MLTKKQMKVMQYIRENSFRSKCTHLSKNQNYREITATIEKENKSQQKFDQIRNVKYHNRKNQEMANRLLLTFNNAIPRKKRKWSFLLTVYLKH